MPLTDPNTSNKPDYPGILAITCLVMAHKFPLDLLLVYLPAILRKNGAELTQLWVLSLPLIPFWFRWAWSPVIDHIGSDRFGHRKSWILPCTVVTSILYALISFVDPEPVNLFPLILMFTLAGVVMASQEVASDAYMVENIKPSDRNIGSAYIELGRSAAAIGIAVGLMALYDNAGWVYTMGAATTLFFVLTLPVLIRREPTKPSELQQRIGGHQGIRLRDLSQSPKKFFRAIAFPFIHFFTRREGGLLIALIIFMGINLKLGQTVLAVFLIDINMSLTEAGLIIGVFAAGGSVLGAIISAWMLKHLTILQSAKVCFWCLIIAFTPIIIMSSYDIQSKYFAMLAFAFLGILVTPTQVLVMAARFRWTSKAQAGTDFTLQSSAEYVGYAIGTAIAGPLAAMIGWGAHFSTTLGLSLVALTVFIATHAFIEKSIAEREMQQN